MAVLIALDDDDAVTCCLDDKHFNERLEAFEKAQMLSSKQRDGLRRSGARSAADQLGPADKVPTALLGNSGQGEKSSMAIVNHGSGIVPLPVLPPAAAPTAAACPIKQPAREPEPDAEAAPEAPAQHPPELLAAKELKYAKKLRHALTSETAANRVSLARMIVSRILQELTPIERAAVLADVAAAAEAQISEQSVAAPGPLVPEHAATDDPPELAALAEHPSALSEPASALSASALEPASTLAEPSVAADAESLAPESLAPKSDAAADWLVRSAATPAAASTLGDEDEDEGEATGGSTFQVFVKTREGVTLTINVREAFSVLQLKREVKRELQARGKEPIEPQGQKLMFGGKNLDDKASVSSYNLQKQSTIHLVNAGRVYAPSRSVNNEDDEEDHEEVRVSTVGGSSSTADVSAPRPTLRMHALNGNREFDGSDGWAVAEGIQVGEAQRWYRNERTNLRWEPWKNGNQLVYLLNCSSGFEHEVASFLTGTMGNTAMGKPHMWQPAPHCLLEIDRQLRGVFVNPHLASSPPLLGNDRDGPFVLGYVQVSQMPVALRERAMPRGEAQPKVQAEGRNLGLHYDSPAYGDVIITVTAFGQVSIQLKNRTDPPMAKELLGMERGSRMQGGDADMLEGHAYSLVGKARWKMLHDAIVPPSCPAIEGLTDAMAGGIARVGFTFRYFRRTFLEVRRREQLGAPPPSTPLPRIFDYVDARYYVNGVIDTAHLYTYAAIVLRVDAASHTLTLQYLSDGLGADTDAEAFQISNRVPAHHARPMHPTIQRVLEDEDCNWTRQSLRRVQRIREMGVDAYLAEQRKLIS